jgi:AraC-like DNA-binding protein
MDDLLISVPFKVEMESVSSRSYFYDNAHRGDACFVIVQRTISGTGMFSSRGRVHDVPVGSAFLSVVPEASSYGFAGRSGVPWVFSWLNFYGGPAPGMARSIRDRHGPVLPLPKNSPAGKLYQSFFGRRSKRADPVSMAAKAYSFLVEWSLELGLGSVEARDPIAAAIQTMRSRFHEPLGIKTLADQAGMTREHFTRLFVDAHGIGPAAYLREIRRHHAQSLLANRANSLKEAALRSGFPSVAALRRAQSTGQ